MKKSLILGVLPALMLAQPAPQLIVPKKPTIELAKPAIIKRPELLAAPQFMFVGGTVFSPAPTIQSVVTTNLTAFGARNVTLPGSIASGNLLVFFGMNKASGTPAGPPTGFTTVFNTTSGTLNIMCAYRIADGSEGATVAWSVLGSNALTAMVMRVTGNHATAAPEGQALGSQSSTGNPNPPSVTPSWGALNTRWIAVALNDNQTTTVTNYPAGYTDNQTTGGAAMFLALSSQSLNAASEDPAVYSLSLATAATAATVALRPV